MTKRGRTSAAELSTVVEGQISAVQRPNAPLDLTPDEAVAWVDTVNAMPADWFPPETWPLLRQWCRHHVTSARVAQMIDAASSREEIDVKEMRELLAMQAKETAAIKALAASMRLSQQASYSARGAGGEKSRRTPIKRPWQ